MERISSQFLAGVSLQEIDLEGVLPEFTECHKQLIFLKSTVQHPVVLKHPLQWKYQIQFLRKAIYILDCISDDKNMMVSPDLHQHMEFLRCSINHTQYDDSEIFKHYTLPNTTDIISVTYAAFEYTSYYDICSPSFLQVKLFLADWMTCHKELFEGKRLLDLGSGHGAAGLIVNRTCRPKEVILGNIDSTEFFMSQRNIEVNGCKNSVRAVDINWNVDGVNEDLDRRNINPEVVMAVDEHTVGVDLIRKLNNLLVILNCRKKSYKIYLAAVRNDADSCPKVSQIGAIGLQVEKVGSSKDTMNNFHWDEQKEIEVFLIQQGLDPYY